MPRPPDTTAEFDDFPGLVNNVASTKVPPGAGLEQVNLLAGTVGRMATRPGFRPAAFETTTTVGLGPDA